MSNNSWAVAALEALHNDGLEACALLRMGSHSHGTHIPPADPNGIDDVDVLVVLKPDAAGALGFSPLDDWRHQEGELDAFGYSWGKFVRLLLKSNPNVLSALWLPSDCECVDPGSPFWSLKSGRAAFASKQVHQSFVGYARAQLHKMKSQAYQGYMGEKRKALVNRYGFDTKNGAHLIRLLRMATEFMGTGTLTVRRRDADELIAIKRGEWTLDAIEQEARRLFSVADEAWKASRLPETPDAWATRKMLLEGYGITDRVPLPG